jgi:hypothetical protein
MSNTLSKQTELKRVLLVGGNTHAAEILEELVGTGAAVTIVGSSNDMTASALDAISKNKATRQIDHNDRDINIDYDIRAIYAYSHVVICMNSNSQARYVSYDSPDTSETSLWQLKGKGLSSKLRTHQNCKKTACLAMLEYQWSVERVMFRLMGMRTMVSHRKHKTTNKRIQASIRHMGWRLELLMDTHPQASRLDYG